MTMMTDAINPVTTNTKIMADIIFPKRRMLVIDATAEEIEKKTSGTIVVKRRLRKTSPNGLKTIASFL